MLLPIILIAGSLGLLGLVLGVRLVSARRRGVYRTLGDIRSEAFSSRTSADQPVLGGLFSEVDTLRIQVESLRADVTALSTGSRSDRAKLKTYRPGQYTQLPRPLRRQVREARSLRHAIRI